MTFPNQDTWLELSKTVKERFPNSVKRTGPLANVLRSLCKSKDWNFKKENLMAHLSAVQETKTFPVTGSSKVLTLFILSSGSGVFFLFLKKKCFLSE